MSPRTCRWRSAHAPACRGSCVVARTVCHQSPARNRGPLFEAAVGSSGAAGQRGGDPPAADGPEVDEILEFVTGRTLEMTGADLVVLALPGEGHPAADNQTRRRERRRPAPVTECDSVLGPTSRGSPILCSLAAVLSACSPATYSPVLFPVRLLAALTPAQAILAGDSVFFGLRLGRQGGGPHARAGRSWHGAWSFFSGPLVSAGRAVRVGLNQQHCALTVILYQTGLPRPWSALTTQRICRGRCAGPGSRTGSAQQRTDAGLCRAAG